MLQHAAPPFSRDILWASDTGAWIWSSISCINAKHIFKCKVNQLIRSYEYKTLPSHLALVILRAPHKQFQKIFSLLRVPIVSTKFKAKKHSDTLFCWYLPIFVGVMSHKSKSCTRIEHIPRPHGHNNTMKQWGVRRRSSRSMIRHRR